MDRQVAQVDRRSTVHVLLMFPPEPDRALVDLVRAVHDSVEVATCGYALTSEERSARTRGDHPDLAPIDAALRRALAQAEVVLGLDLPPDMATLAPRLAWVQATGAGIEHLRGVGLPPSVTVTNVAGVSALSISEFVIARILAAWKRLEELATNQQAHRWEPAYGRVLAGSTVTVVGLGSIGSAVAARARGLGMSVTGIRRHPAPHPACTDVVGPDRLLEALGTADAVVAAAPATPETVNLFDAQAFAAMRPGAFFCNVGRGTAVDEEALVQALMSGKLGAAALDVTQVEPLPPDSPLWDAPHLAISPHCSVSLDRYIPEVYAVFAENLGRFVRGEPLRNVVDLARGY